MMVFYLIILGGKHLETVIRMCLEFQEIRKQRFAPSEGYNSIWMSRDKLGSTLLPARYLFRSTTTDNGVRDSPLSSATAEARLKLYLKEMKADEGETLHGFRSGCAITLALTGADLSEIMEHVGWARRHITCDQAIFC